MKARFIVILLFISSIGHSEIFTYENTYRGITTGVSKEIDVIKLLGKPKNTSVISGNIKYHYDHFQVHFNKKTNTINSIIIFDSNYVDPNGIKIGFTKGDVEVALRSKVSDNYFYDSVKGIVYWIQGGRVSKITLAHELKISE